MDPLTFIDEALAEDIGSGDHTSLATVASDAINTAILLAKQDGVLSGLELAHSIIQRVDPTVVEICHSKDGETLSKGDIIMTLTGKTHSILKLERLMLNCLQRLCGIATTTKKYVDAVKGTNTTILDTRKTTPLFRHYEKAAVKHGGGQNHRIGLFDMILIKDNHIDAAGGIKPALEKAKEYLTINNLQLSIEIETRNLEEVETVIQTGIANRIMFDNFQPSMVTEAVKMTARQMETEASGGITIENIHDYAITGVNFISVGALTHSVMSLDLSLKLIK